MAPDGEHRQTFKDAIKAAMKEVLDPAMARLERKVRDERFS